MKIASGKTGAHGRPAVRHVMEGSKFVLVARFLQNILERTVLVTTLRRGTAILNLVTVTCLCIATSFVHFPAMLLLTIFLKSISH